MREGCLIGCLGLIVVSMILAIVAVVALDGFFGLFRVADRVALTEYYGQDHDLMLLVEPNFDVVGSSVAEASGQEPWLIDYVLPHEATLFIDVDREAMTTSYTVAASLKRMAGFMSYYLPRSDGFTIFNNAKVTDLGVSTNGVAYIEAQAPVSEETTDRASTMTAIAVESPYTIEGGHLGELILNNSRGEAFIALQELFGGSDNAAASGELLTPDEERILGENLTTAKLTFDTVNAETVTMLVRARVVDPAKAAEIVPLLEKALQQTVAADESGRTQIEGALRAQDGELIGEYTLTHIRHQIGESWDKSFDDLKRQIEEHKESQ